MEFIPIKISQQGQHPHSELSFKSDCTEIKHIAIDRWYGQITTIQTYCSQDVSKEQNLIFPTKIIKFFKLLSSSEFGRRFWFDDCSRGTFNEAGIDTNYDADVGDIFSGDSKSDFMRYIYRDMVLPFKKLEKENKHLREQLESKDQEIERKDQELAQMKKQLESKDQELKEKDQEASTLISDILLMPGIPRDEGLNNCLIARPVSEAEININIFLHIFSLRPWSHRNIKEIDNIELSKAARDPVSSIDMKANKIVHPTRNFCTLLLALK